jgi:hypothetical protein
MSVTEQKTKTYPSIAGGMFGFLDEKDLTPSTRLVSQIDLRKNLLSVSSSLRYNFPLSQIKGNGNNIVFQTYRHLKHENIAGLFLDCDKQSIIESYFTNAFSVIELGGLEISRIPFRFSENMIPHKLLLPLSVMGFHDMFVRIENISPELFTSVDFPLFSLIIGTFNLYPEDDLYRNASGFTYLLTHDTPALLKNSSICDCPEVKDDRTYNGEHLNYSGTHISHGDGKVTILNATGFTDSKNGFTDCVSAYLFPLLNVNVKINGELKHANYDAVIFNSKDCNSVQLPTFHEEHKNTSTFTFEPIKRFGDGITHVLLKFPQAINKDQFSVVIKRGQIEIPLTCEAVELEKNIYRVTNFDNEIYFNLVNCIPFNANFEVSVDQNLIPVSDLYKMTLEYAYVFLNLDTRKEFVRTLKPVLNVVKVKQYLLDNSKPYF